MSMFCTTCQKGHASVAKLGFISTRTPFIFIHAGGDQGEKNNLSGLVGEEAAIAARTRGNTYNDSWERESSKWLSSKSFVALSKEYVEREKSALFICIRPRV